MARPFTREEAFAWALRTLGDGVVVVEVTSEQVEDAWDDAIEWFIANCGINRIAVATYYGPGEYTLPADTGTVINVYFPRALYPGWDYSSLEMVDLERAYTNYGSDSDFSNYYTTMVLWMQRAETASRLTSSEPHWLWRPEIQRLQVFPSSRSITGSIMADYVSTEVYDTDPVKSTDHPNDLRRMPTHERKFLLEYFLAQVKIRLGRIRSKYVDGLPSASGKTVLDGDLLLNEAKETIEDLTNKLSNYGHVPVLTG